VADGVAEALRCGKRPLFWFRFSDETRPLTKTGSGQAGGKSDKQWAFFCRSIKQATTHAQNVTVRETGFLSHLYIKVHLFTKTGSGQT
jgi:hypothetical protein